MSRWSMSRHLASTSTAEGRVRVARQEGGTQEWSEASSQENVSSDNTSTIFRASCRLA
eukprot:CAMPEP_0173062206 /NCGR_PEP_ID=MMETSP1102-20130122/3670_1 /TAXON_ID=49646 /ORGANISM="Geminigera sp., Strain Caron Lab Isolate" /LENGTH=57 /DNA_ID=CAMNT_0013928813 /DNA_START=518 /DNA_END=688 /DNA_ORIENTATION=-